MNFQNVSPRASQAPWQLGDQDDREKISNPTSYLELLSNWDFKNLAFDHHWRDKQKSKSMTYWRTGQLLIGVISGLMLGIIAFLNSEPSAITNWLLQLTLDTKKIEFTLQTSTAESHPPDMISGRTRCSALKYPRQN